MDLRLQSKARASQPAGPTPRIAPREEPPSTDNVVVLWHQPGGGIHKDIWADNGLVFAPSASTSLK